MNAPSTSSALRSVSLRFVAAATAVAAVAFGSTGCASNQTSARASDPSAVESPGNPGAESTLNEYTAPDLGGSFAVAGDPPMGNPALAGPPPRRVPTSTTVTTTSATVTKAPIATPYDIDSTSGAGTASEGARGTSGSSPTR